MCNSSSVKHKNVISVINYRLPEDFEISRIVQESGIINPWIRTSAKSGEGVKEAFNLIVRYIMAADTWNPPAMDPLDSILDPHGYSLSSPEYNRNRVRSDESDKAEIPESEEDNIVRLPQDTAKPNLVPLCFC